jgi:hypothetical protein
VDRSGTLHALNPRRARRLLIGPEPPSPPSPLGFSVPASCPPALLPLTVPGPPLLIAQVLCRIQDVSRWSCDSSSSLVPESSPGESLKMLTLAFPTPLNREWHVRNGPEWLSSLTLFAELLLVPGQPKPTNRCRCRSRPWTGGVMVADIATHLLGSLQ